MKITNSYYVSRTTGDKITVHTYHGPRDTYAIFNGGWRVAECARKSSVRRYIMVNDCQPVESH